MDHKQKFNMGKPMFWGFLLPLILMLLSNMAILLYFSRNICRTNPNLNRYVYFGTGRAVINQKAFMRIYLTNNTVAV